MTTRHTRSANKDSTKRCDNGGSVTPVPGKKKRLSPRHHDWNACCDIDKLPNELKCGGCTLFEGSTRKKERSTCTSERYDCYQGWKRDVSSVPVIKKGHVQAIKAWIATQVNVDCDAVFDAPLPRPKKITFASPVPTTTEPTNASVVSPQEPQKRQVRLYEDTVRSNGQSITVTGIPKTHTIVLTADLNRWKNDSRTLSRIRNKFQQKQYTTDSLLGQSLWAIAMSAVPALANAAAQYLFPLIFFAFFHHTGLFNRIDLELFAQSFPSDWSFRKFTIHQAVRDTILLGNELRGTKIYIAVDKGNKKGVGHFAKCVSSWTRQGQINLKLLDIDAAGGASLECAAGIQASMNKLKDDENQPNTHLLYGQNTDSGGGGTLESLHLAMEPLGMCAPANQYLIGNCTIHAHQIGLKNAVETTFGSGALDKINAMQLLHSVFRLQESIDLDEWRYILHKSSQFVVDYDPTIVDTMTPLNAKERNLLQFYQSYNKVLAFHSKFIKRAADPSEEYKGSVLAKMQQPILTRWWTVGSAASYTFDYYLVLYHVCQTIVNIYKSDRTPHGIASDLFAMMSDQENFIDMTLIRSYNKACLNPHLDWLQGSKDLTGHVGFQSHHVAFRYYLMDRNLRQIISSGRSMQDYHEAVARLTGPEDTFAVDKERHTKKLFIFLNTALSSLEKHFDRWLTAKLLPTALMSEPPIAKVVAAVMLKRPFPSFESDQTARDERRLSGKMAYNSTAHDKTGIDLLKYDKFL